MRVPLLILLGACRDPEPIVIEPEEAVDVLVIGGGPAGLSAAWAASEAGATVRVLEREPVAGGAGAWPGRYYGADTRFQAELGIPDSIDLALYEWAAFTDGGDGDDPRVRWFVERSGPVVEWLVDDLGARVFGMTPEHGKEGAIRMHDIGGASLSPVVTLVERLESRTWVEREATGLVFEDGRVVGAQWTDLADGTDGWTRANATIVATGGFARDLQRVLSERAELEGVPLLFEHDPVADGGGIPLLEPAGATWQNRGALGVYVHAIEDWRAPGEALWVPGLDASVLIDTDGRRIANEEWTHGYRLLDVVLGLREPRVYAVLRRDDFLASRLPGPGYGPTGGEPLLPDEVIAAGGARLFDDVAAMAAALDIDATALAATFDRYEGFCADGFDADFGKSPLGLASFGGGGYAVLELRPGVSKAYAGFAVDLGGRVTDATGAPIPGLYAAGEVIGMLGTPGIGRGLPGSITAVYATGLAAGENAAAD